MTTILFLLILGSLVLWAVLATFMGLHGDGYGRLEVSQRNSRTDDLPR
ncbi:MAG TPA: hypothetical protein VLO00_07405 [Cryobacterium sp.]|nr:hypothetical protein [Cryobacterium sp.]